MFDQKCPCNSIGQRQNGVLNTRQDRVSNPKCNFSFFNFELVTQTWKGESLTIELQSWKKYCREVHEIK